MRERLRFNQRIRNDKNARSNDLGSGGSRRFTAGLLRDRIVATLPDGTRAAPVMRRVADATQKFWGEIPLDCNWENAEVIERGDKRWLRISKRRYPAKGRPKKEAVRRYVTTLVEIYESATGRKIRRIVYSGSDKRIGQQKRHPFLVACLRLAGIATYPTALIREALEER